MWFKIDDSFYDHPKTFDAPDCAVALWVRAGTWSARNLTDGFVPTGLPARLCDDHDTAVRELLRRGLWDRTGGGYKFHDWKDYQPSGDQLAALKSKRAEAGRLGGLAKAAKQDPGNRLASASGVAKQNPAPTRPDPKESSSNSLTQPDGFDEFWAAYPRHVAKAAAVRAYAKARKAALAGEIVKGAHALAERCYAEQTDQKYIPHPATWLNQARWNDHLEAKPPARQRSVWEN